MVDRRDDRSPFAVALEWSSRLTTIALEMLLPPLFGHWLDQRLGTGVLLVIVGLVVGFATGLYSLVKLNRPPDSGDQTK